MTIACLSDTHSLHHRIPSIPDADILIHAGDISKYGDESQVVDFLHWFSALPHKHKIFIAGNHDFFFENKREDYIRTVIPDNVIYLNDSGCEINGIRIWGSPISPEFMNWAFNRKRDTEIQQHWNKIPENTDILITHGPPAGILDTTTNFQKTGCEDLLNTVLKIRPAFHIFGHIHEAHGIITQASTTFVNAAILDENTG
ncbi:MAG TPA: metallophosphatase domain-containing protein [Chitinophagales bacterium]|nr:metallophosphatase domain-containing protein [Chitinophagales bacterium]